MGRFVVWSGVGGNVILNISKNYIFITITIIMKNIHIKNYGGIPQTKIFT